MEKIPYEYPKEKLWTRLAMAGLVILLAFNYQWCKAQETARMVKTSLADNLMDKIKQLDHYHEGEKGASYEYMGDKYYINYDSTGSYYVTVLWHWHRLDLFLTKIDGDTYEITTLDGEGQLDDQAIYELNRRLDLFIKPPTDV